MHIAKNINIITLCYRKYIIMQYGDVKYLKVNVNKVNKYYYKL